MVPINLKDEPYPLDVPKEETHEPGVVEEPPDEKKPEPPITLNCFRSHEQVPAKNDAGRVSVSHCETKCLFREDDEGKIICDVYEKYRDSIKT